MATQLTTLELESEFLWMGNGKKYLKDIIENLYKKLTSSEFKIGSSFTIPLDSFNILSIQYQQKYQKPQDIQSYEVPIFVNENHQDKLKELLKIHSHIVLLEVQKKINGKRYVKQIAQELYMDVEVVKASLQHLLLHNIIKMIDIFQFNNIYAATKKITKFAYDRDLQQKCIDYVQQAQFEIDEIDKEQISLSNRFQQDLDSQIELKELDNEEDEDFFLNEITMKIGQEEQHRKSTTLELNQPKIISIYAEICSGKKIKDFLMNFGVEGLNSKYIKKFIEFGLLHDLIYRVHKYAKWISPASPQHHWNSTSQLITIKTQDKTLDLQKSYNKRDQIIEQLLSEGRSYCFDEICVELNITPNELEQKIIARTDIVTYYV